MKHSFSYSSLGAAAAFASGVVVVRAFLSCSTRRDKFFVVDLSTSLLSLVLKTCVSEFLVHD